MKIVIIGQQDFGRAVLEAFLERGDQVLAVFCAPEKEGSKPDVLKIAAMEQLIPVYQYPNLRDPEVIALMKKLSPDLGVMAYVLQFVPEDLLQVPKFGTIQYHPSLLPKYRGPSSINWPIIQGETKTGLTIFRPTDGLDEGPVLLQKEVTIGPDDTLGSVYFDYLFPLGVQAILEAADGVVQGSLEEIVQDEQKASYEGWCRKAESMIYWARHVDQVYNLIRGCNPAPGAWTTLNGHSVYFFDSQKHLCRTFSGVQGKVGQVSEITKNSIKVVAQGGQIEVFKVRVEGGKKISAAEWAHQVGLTVGLFLGN